MAFPSQQEYIKKNSENKRKVFLDIFFKYFFYWKFFLIATVTFVFLGFLFLRYTPTIYKSTAKIKILDSKESSLQLETLQNMFSNSQINIENEVQVMSSFSILSQVVNNLDLNSEVYALWDITKSLEIDYPFNIDIDKIKIEELIQNDDVLEYKIDLTDDKLEITDKSNNKTLYFKNFNTLSTKHELPFEIKSVIKNEWSDNGFLISLSSQYDAVLRLKKQLKFDRVGNESDLIMMEHSSSNKDYSQRILNELINVYDNDGITDRQLVHKRTIEFVDGRFVDLSTELDSIEIKKQFFKKENNLIDINVNSTLSLEKSSKSEETLLEIENQILLSELLLKSLKKDNYNLLPSKIGVENIELNNQISSYNDLILERKKLLISAGKQNPSLIIINQQIKELKINVNNSIDNHNKELNQLKSLYKNQFSEYFSEVSRLPEKEKILRSIERNQVIKETLFLFLLKKREEAEVSFAVTESSIKIVERALTDMTPKFPKPSVIYLISLMLGLGIPYLILYLNFLFDTKVKSRADINLWLGDSYVISEVPEISDDNLIRKSSDRSVLAESFRILASNLRYLMKNEKSIILTTSTIKSEGKTFSAINLAITYSNLGKKVLLIGADLRNPQLHSYLNINKDEDGLVNYLIDEKFQWKKSLKRMQNCDILIAGKIPSNPTQLLNGERFGKLLNEAKKIYDYIIIDSPPTLLVSDTLSISYHADVTLYITRAERTDTNLMSFIKDNIDSGKIKNPAIVLNGIGAKDKYGYRYGYGYGYLYSYKYNYNYGYGYGYGQPDLDSEA